jgi:tetratricopeptide (TPR) repeat protein
MRSKELTLLMNNPKAIHEDVLLELRNLMDEFPYFQTARLLYLKALCNIKDSSFASELRKSAFYSGDRKSLFYLLVGEHLEKIRAALDRNEYSAGNESFELIDIFLKNTGGIGDIPDYFSKKHTAYSLKEDEKKEEEKEEKEVPPPSFKHEDIIEQFLNNDREHPIRPDMENFHPDDPVEQKHVDGDLQEKSLTFSETLAKIYTKQQKYDKALEIIRKLHLLYPEKSVYFADQIQNLEKLIINAK